VKTKGDVFDAIFSPQRALAVKFKADLCEAILKVARKYSAKQLEAILHEPQPRVSELLNGKLGSKSIEKLLQYAQRLGIEVEGSFSQTRKEVPQRELEAAGV
jgi:predicted XRE-type DNA-binding protein